ncbi:MAG TPA: sulfate adenylyltransferase subunit CysN [Polyangiales bacterium]|nr:sulfate adenylyltransferase subunit CysN [Polyangiales bacterium]
MSADEELIEKDILGFLAKHEHKELLRFVIVGSVDDGKSTLIGRLLFELKAVYEDQLEAVRKATTMVGVPIDFSLITDGLEAEREQGITIDVAYRYFTTEKRKFIVADTPGHVQYTRNMVTGASTADVAVILIDARLGVLEQSRRHAYLASLLGIPHLLVAVNKMDLVGYDQKRFEAIREEFSGFCKGLSFKDVTFIPVSALLGENVVQRGEKVTWYKGPTVLGFLETVPIAEDQNLTDFRYPVQYVLRPNLNYRGFAGQIASGVVRKGDEVMILPSGKTSRVKAIDTFAGERDEAFAPESVTLRLEHEIDCSRGDMIVLPGNRPRTSRSFDAHVVWLHEKPLDPEKSYFLKHTTQTIRMQVSKVHNRIELTTLEEVPADTLQLNEIGLLSITTHRPTYHDAYQQNRVTGAFVIVDSLSNATVGAGMILPPEEDEQDIEAALREVRAGSGLENKTQVSPRERRERLGQTGVTVWLSGLPGSGKVNVAYVLERKLFDLGHAAHVLAPEGDPLSAIAVATRGLTDAGIITICALPAKTRAERALVQDRVGKERFVEVFVDTDPTISQERRPDADHSGFEPPDQADVTVNLDQLRVERAVNAIIDLLAKRGWVDLA